MGPFRLSRILDFSKINLPAEMTVNFRTPVVEGDVYSTLGSAMTEGLSV